MMILSDATTASCKAERLLILALSMLVETQPDYEDRGGDRGRGIPEAERIRTAANEFSYTLATDNVGQVEVEAAIITLLRHVCGKGVA